MKLKVLKIWLLASGVILLSVLVVALVKFGNVYSRAETAKNSDLYKANITDMPGTKIVLATLKINKKTQVPLTLNFTGGQVVIDELEMGPDIWTARGLSREAAVLKTGQDPVPASYGVWIKAEGITAIYSSFRKVLGTDKYDGKPFIIFRNDLLSDKTDRMGEEKLYRRFYLTMEPDIYDEVNPVYDLIVGSVEQTESNNTVIFN